MNEDKDSRLSIWSVMIIIMVALLAAAASILFIVVLPATSKIKQVKEDAGSAVGEVIGTGIGIVTGQGELIEGFEEGKEQGLSAEDTEVETRKKVESLGSGILEVMTAEISIRNVQTQGEQIPTGAYYAALYRYGAHQ